MEVEDRLSIDGKEMVVKTSNGLLPYAWVMASNFPRLGAWKKKSAYPSIIS